MLKLLENTQSRLIVKEQRRPFDAIILKLFLISSATYSLLIFILKIWSNLSVKNSFLKFTYDTIAHPLLTYLNSIGLFILIATFLPMLMLESWFPTRTFTFDRQSNLLIIEFKYLFWHHKIEYLLNEIQCLQWVTEQVCTGAMTVMQVPFLKIIRREQNGKTDLIPIRYRSHQETCNIVELINLFLLDKKKHR